MKYKITVSDIYEFGQRKDAQGNPHQEDSIYPAAGQASGADRLFILCDGMGGHDAGEVASATVCQAMSQSILASEPDPQGAFTDADVESAIAAAFDALDAQDTGSAKKMGTTMTMLKLYEGGACVAHMGDSRVYQIRPGATGADTRIVFRTEDHSLVNDLIKIGELTEEEAKHSSQKNVITRAMQPHMERRPRADVAWLTDIRPGDYFYMCSDGMLEEMTDQQLCYHFSDAAGDACHKVANLIAATQENRDNHSAIIVRITDVEGAPVGGLYVEAEEADTPAPAPAPTPQRTTAPAAAPRASQPAAKSGNGRLTTIMIAVVVLVGFGIYWMIGGKSQPDQAPAKSEQSETSSSPIAPEGKQNEPAARPDASGGLRSTPTGKGAQPAVKPDDKGAADAPQTGNDDHTAAGQPQEQTPAPTGDTGGTEHQATSTTRTNTSVTKTTTSKTTTINEGKQPPGEGTPTAPSSATPTATPATTPAGGGQPSTPSSKGAAPQSANSSNAAATATNAGNKASNATAGQDGKDAKNDKNKKEKKEEDKKTKENNKSTGDNTPK